MPVAPRSSLASTDCPDAGTCPAGHDPGRALSDIPPDTAATIAALARRAAGLTIRDARRLFTQLHIHDTLLRTGGNRTAAARRLGIDRGSLLRLLREPAGAPDDPAGPPNDA